MLGKPRLRKNNQYPTRSPSGGPSLPGGFFFALALPLNSRRVLSTQKGFSSSGRLVTGTRNSREKSLGTLIACSALRLPKPARRDLTRVPLYPRCAIFIRSSSRALAWLTLRHALFSPACCRVGQVFFFQNFRRLMICIGCGRPVSRTWCNRSGAIKVDSAGGPFSALFYSEFTYKTKLRPSI